ncbi:hypothetical protein ACS3SW_19775 [Roseobacteraceae bacterium S113]
MAEYIDTLGHECYVVVDTGSCVEALAHAPNDYELVIIDTSPSGECAIGVARTIRAATKACNRHIAIIAIIDDTVIGKPAPHLEAAFDEVISKPVDLSALDIAILRHAA